MGKLRISLRAVLESFHLHRARREDWGDAMYWLVSTAFSGLMPVWLPWFFMLLLSRRLTIAEFTSNGEFALISASLVSASYYVVTKESNWNLLRSLYGRSVTLPKDLATFPHQRLFGYSALVLALLSALTFAGSIVSRVPGTGLSLNAELVQPLSLALFGLTIFMSFFITVIDNAFTNPIGLAETRKQDIQGLRDQFEKLGNEADHE